MLMKARSREEFDYDIERQGQAHYELLQEIQSLETRPGQSPPPLWTTTTTDVKVDRRYGRPYDGALKECAPYFFLHYICQDPERGRFMTNLFVKRGIAQLFFRMPRLRLEHVVQHGQGETSAKAPAESVLEQVDDLAQAHQTIERLQRDNANQATSHAAITSKLGEVHRQIAEQQEENSTNLSRLSESQEKSARQVEQIQECQRKIAELETANRALTHEDSREQLETAKQLHEMQVTINSLNKTIADHQELQVSSVQASQNQQQIHRDLERSRSEVTSLQQRIVEYQSQCDRQALDSEYLRQQLAAQTQEAMAEKQELQTMLGEWEKGDRQAATDANMTGDGPSSQELQACIKELESANQQQAQALMSVRAEKALKDEGLEMMFAKTQGLREGVEKITEYFTTKLKLEPDYKGGDCETIHSEEDLPSTRDLVTTGRYCNEIEALERSISAFIALYGRADVLHNNSSIEILEWQKDVSKAQLSINEASDGPETNTPRMNGMLSMVKRRAGIIEQEARNTYDLQTELEATRETIYAQRQRLETLDEELKEARNQATKLQEEYQTTISSLEEALKVAQDENEAVRKEAEGTGNLRAELSTVRAENKALRNRQTELDGQIRGNAETWKTEEARILDLEQYLTEARSSLETTSHVQEELNQAQSDLDELRQWSSSYIQGIKTARDTYEKQLEVSKGQATRLEKDLETAQQSARTMEEELRDLKTKANDEDERVRRLKAQLLQVNRLIDLETAQQSARTMEEELRDLKTKANDEDERVRRLKAQLLQVNRLIDLEKEKLRRETELETTQVAVAQAKANASRNQDMGDLMRREAELRADISRVEDSIVQTGVEVLKCSSRKVRFQSARTGYRRGVDHVAMEDLENMLAKLHGQIVYCFVDGTFTLVEPMRFQDYLANPKQLADDGEFFYCDSGYARKRRRGLDEEVED